MEDLNKKLKDVELIKYVKYYTEFKDRFVEIRDLAMTHNKSDLVNQAQYEIDVCSLMLKTEIQPEHVKIKSRFESMMVYPDGSKWPDIVKFTNDQYKYYEKRLLETSNTFLKVRYSDFLFEFGNNKIEINKYDLSQNLIPNLREINEHYRLHKEYYQYISTMRRLVEVSLLMRNREQLSELIELINSQLDIFNIEKEYRWIIDLSTILRVILNSALKELVSNTVSIFFVTVLENSRKTSLNNEDYHNYKFICEELIGYAKYDLIDSEKVNELQLNIRESYELESEYQGGAQIKSSFIKSVWLQKAMVHYKNLGFKEKIDEMKVLIREVYKQMDKDDEWKKLSVSVSIPMEEIDLEIERLTSSTLETNLDNVAKNLNFIPKVSTIEKQILKEKFDFPLINNVPKSIIGDDKKIVQASSEEDLYEVSFIQSYTSYLQINMRLLVVPIFEKLIDEQNLCTDNFMEKFDRWGLLDNRNRLFIKTGISKFLEDDYISSLHILVPQFESTLKRLFSNAGYPTTSFKKEGAQQEETFNVFLKRDEIISALGVNIHKLIQIVMVEQSGLNLRNEIAHGLIKYSDIDKTKCVLVIFLFLVLTNFNYTETN